MSSPWTTSEVQELVRLIRDEKLTTEQAAERLGKTFKSVASYIVRHKAALHICRRGKLSDPQRKSARKGTPPGGYTRRRHDCGCPTTDYRCPECWKKWRLAHGCHVYTDSSADIMGGDW